MIRQLIALTLLAALSAFGGSYPWLDPATYDRAMSCDSTGLTGPYKSRIQGFTTYKVQATPADPANPGKYLNPVIDGLLEDNIWFHSETLLINAWNDAGVQSACTESRFYGPQDMHAIWRFMYSQDAFYVGIEVHDDILDVDSLKSWARQDGIELCVDPWDWGEADQWKQEPLVSQIRRYWSPNNALVPFADGGHLTWFKFLKRLNNEPYLAGVIRGIQKQYYGKGDEVNNHVVGIKECTGIDCAAAFQGVDPWGRKVWHLEFKFAYHGPLWAELEGKGFYTTAGLPRTGNLFKMDFLNNDDDILGADGSSPNFLQMGRRHSESPWWDTHWSDNRFYMTMEYANPLEQKNVAHPYVSGGKHGDSRIGGMWVNAVDATDLADYPFTPEGTVTIGGVYYYFDSTGAGGSITTLGGVAAGSYTLKANPDKEVLLDTLNVNLTSGTSVRLHRKLLTGYSEVEGRWVEAKLVTADISGCTIRDSVMVPKSDTAREYRFCPLSKMLPSLGYADSVKIYRYGVDTQIVSYTYTERKAITGRTKTHFTYEFLPKRIIRAGNIGAPRNIKVSWLNSSGTVVETDTLMEIKKYNIMRFGESGVLAVGGNPINKTVNLISNSPRLSGSTSDSIWRVKVDKYDGLLQFYLGDSGAAGNRLRVNLYDSLILIADSSNGNFWKSAYRCRMIVDSFKLAGYDSVSKVASGGAVPKAGRIFADGDWVQQRCSLIIFAEKGSVKADTFTFMDTTHVRHWDYWLMIPPSGPSYRNLIDSASCPILVHGILAETADPNAQVMSVSNNPNPFNPNTLVRFSIPAQKVQTRYVFQIYDVRGSLVRTLVKGTVGSIGIQKRIMWDGSDNLGRKVSAGIYYYRLTAGSKVLRGSMVMVK